MAKKRTASATSVELEQIRKELTKWTDRSRGILVHAVDREKWEQRKTALG